MLRRGNISSKDTIRFHALKHSPVFLWSVMKGHGVPHNATAHRHSIVAQALTILAEEYVIGRKRRRRLEKNESLDLSSASAWAKNTVLVLATAAGSTF